MSGCDSAPIKFLKIFIGVGATVVKNPPANAGGTRDVGSIPRLGRSPEVGNWQPIPVFSPEKFHGQRSLVGYSPQGQEESDMTER